MAQKTNFRLYILIFMILGAALSRLIPHPYNFAPVGAMALFGAAYFSNRILAFAVPMLSIWVSDVVLNNTVYAKYYKGFTLINSGWYITYGVIALTTLLGFWMLRKVNFKNVLLSSVLASVLFFLVTNIACWPGSSIYPQNFTGLILALEAGIPFFGGTLLGNVFYSAVLFGGFELAKKRYSALQFA